MNLHKDFSTAQGIRPPRDPMRTALALPPEDWFQVFVDDLNRHRDSSADLTDKMRGALSSLKQASATHISVCQRAVKLATYDLHRIHARYPAAHAARQDLTTNARNTLACLYDVTTDVAGDKATPETVHRLMNPLLNMVDWFQAKPCYFRDDPWDHRDLADHMKNMAQNKHGNPECRALLQTAAALVQQTKKAVWALDHPEVIHPGTPEKNDAAISVKL